MKPKILHTKAFRDQFMACLSRRPVSVEMAAPFIGKIPGFGSIVSLSRFLLAKDCELLRLITKPPQSQAGGSCICKWEADQMLSMGAEVLIRTKLHSKVYQLQFREGDRAAFVGSANLTMGGFDRNDETVAFFQQRDDNDAVAKELERLSGRGTYPLPHWKILTNTGGQ